MSQQPHWQQHQPPQGWQSPPPVPWQPQWQPPPPQQVVVKNAHHPVSATLWVVGTLVFVFFVLPFFAVAFIFVAMGAL